jgi:hypothetical protein
MRIIGLGILLASLEIFPAVADAGPGIERIDTGKLFPQGLYRADSVDSTIWQEGGAVVRSHTDGATGITTVDTTSPDGRSYRTTHKEGPNTHCRRMGMPVIPSLGEICTTVETRNTKNGFYTVGECRTARVTVTVSRLDEDTWEVVEDYRSNPNARRSGPSSLRPLAEYLSKHGKTEEERAKAAKLLAELPRIQAKLT